MSWIQVNQEQIAEPVAAPVRVQYRIRMNVVDSADIEPELFVFRTADGLFMNVATVSDLKAYPPSKAEADGAGSDFYRGRALDVVYTNERTASEASAHFQRKLKQVVDDYGAVAPVNFGGVDTFVYDSGETS